jgi:8-amino-7-oxononanoate synthase
MNASRDSMKVLSGRTVTGPISARMTIDGKPYVNFFGAAYLALSGIPAIREAVLEQIRLGAPWAQHLPAAHGATDPVFGEVERAGARACQTEASIYFASGYLIGAVGLAAVDVPFDLIAMDETAHFSLQDAATLSRRPVFAFRHCDVDSLRDVLNRNLRPGQRAVLLTDGAFATTGRIPPLGEYAAVLASCDGRMLIDESHAFGVVGENGRGAAEHCGVESVAIRGATLSKAYCAQGAIVGCSGAAAVRSHTTVPTRAANAGSPLSAAAATATLEYVAAHPEVRDRVREMTDYLRMRLRDAGLDVISSPAPIVSFRCGSGDEMQALQRKAFDRGIYLHYSRYIGAGVEGMIRCAVFRDHSRSDIDELIDMLG